MALQDIEKQKIGLNIGGMTCAACVFHVEKALKEVDGVVSVDVNLATERATLHYLGDVATLEDLSRAVAGAGYSVEGIAGEEEEQRDRERLARTRLIKDQRNRFLVAGGLGLVIFLGSFKEWFPWMPSFLQNWYVLWALATPVQFWAGGSVLQGSLERGQARHDQHEHA